MTRLSLLPPRARTARLLAILAGLALAAQAVVGAQAQEAEPSIAITTVGSEAFPSVTAHLTVAGANGLPLVGLAAADFTVLEDGRAVPAGDVVLASDNSQPLTLVLAVDLAMPGSELMAVQLAVRAFIDSLGPDDQVAVLTFAEDVVVAQAFSNDQVALATAIGGLAPSGNATLFNQAAETAVNMLSTLPTGRKAVLLFTDSGDTANTLSPEPIISTAEAGGIALYPFGHGTRVNRTVLENWARFTGGQAFLLSAPAQIQSSLQTLGVLLRQSYSLSYTSGVTADNARHELTIQLDYQDQTAVADSRFIALPGEVAIDGLTIANGQTLRGMVFLIADVTAPAPVESVTFVLDGETLVELTSPPYHFDWDTATAGAGTHAVTVLARDRVGNTGETQVSVNVAVPAPVAPTAAPMPTAAPTESRVSGLARSALNVGRNLLMAAALLGAFIIALLLWLRARSAQRPALVTGYQLELTNRGNARTQFELRAEDPARLMKFQFLVNDAGLTTRSAAAGAVYSPASVAQVAPAAGLAPAPAAAPNGKDKKAKARGPKPKNALQKAQGVAYGAAGISQRITGWVVAVTYFLPSKLSSKVRVKTASVRDIGFQAHEAAEAPDRYGRMVEHVVDVDDLKGKFGGARGKASLPPAQTMPATGAGASTLPAVMAVAPAANIGTLSSAPAATAAAPAQPTLKNVAANTAGWAVTPAVEPGATLAIKLHILPLRVPKTQTYGFRVLSRAADGGKNTLTQIEHGSVALAGVPWYKQLLPWLLFMIMLGALAVLVWYGLSTLGLLAA